MQITKIGHSCVTVTADNTTAIIDPGVFTSVEALEALDTVQALFLTHGHSDHITQDRAELLLQKFPKLAVYANEETTEQLKEWGISATSIKDGQTLQHDALRVSAVESDHHPIHQDVPVVRNTALTFNDTFMHPGDMLHVPDTQVEAVAIPFAPFVSIGQIVEYCLALKTNTLLAVHDGYFAVPGPYEGVTKSLLKKHDIDFSWFHNGESVTL